MISQSAIACLHAFASLHNSLPRFESLRMQRVAKHLALACGDLPNYDIYQRDLCVVNFETLPGVILGKYANSGDFVYRMEVKDGEVSSISSNFDMYSSIISMAFDGGCTNCRTGVRGNILHFSSTRDVSENLRKIEKTNEFVSFIRVR